MSGFRNRYKNKRDLNEPQIVATLEAHGFSVIRADTPVDLVLGWGRQTFLVEIKNGNTSLTKAQIDFFETWLGHAEIIRSIADADAFATRVKNEGQ